MRYATLEAAAAQIQGLVRSRSDALGLWLDAALQEGHFDVVKARARSFLVDVAEQGAQAFVDGPLAQCNGAVAALKSLLVRRSAEMLGPLEPTPAGQGMHEPEGVGAFLLKLVSALNDSLASTLRDLQLQAAAAADRAQRMELEQRIADARCEHYDSISMVALCATAYDRAEVLQQCLSAPECAHWRADMPNCAFFEATLLGQLQTYARAEHPVQVTLHGEMSLHLGSVAAHYGSIRCLDLLLAGGWNPHTHAALNPRLPVTQAAPSGQTARQIPVDDLSHEDDEAFWSEIGASRRIGIAALYRSRIINVSAEALKLVVQWMEDACCLSADARHHLAWLARGLRRDFGASSASTLAWGRFLAHTGLVRSQPSALLAVAGAQGATELLDVLDALVDWDALARIAPDASQPSIKSVLFAQTPEQAEAAAMWFVEMAARRQKQHPSLLQNLMYRVGPEFRTFSDVLVMLDLAQPLARLLSHGMEPQRPAVATGCAALESAQVPQPGASGLGTVYRSLMDSLRFHGRPHLQAMVLAHRARDAAREALREMEMELHFAVA